MNRIELERKYEERGLTDYQLRNLEDLKAVHGIDILNLPGYSDLLDYHKNLFIETVIRFFNSFGLDNRSTLVPKSINYVREIEFSKDVSEYEELLVGILIFAVNLNTGYTHILHSYIFETDIPLEVCHESEKYYFRFELENEWFHITENGQWY